MERHTAPGPPGPGRATADTFGRWRELLSATYVRLAADPVDTGPFFGCIENVRCGEITLSTMAAGGQRVRRTRSLIRHGNEEFLLATILLAGSGRIEQDDRRALLTTGSMVFYDSARPYMLESDGPFRQIVVRVPKRLLPVVDWRRCTARPLGSGTPGAVVASFLASLTEAALDGDDRIAPFATHAAALFATAAAFAARPEPPTTHLPVLDRIVEHLHRNFADPQLNASAVATACHLSRRSLYRAVGEGGLAGRLRQIRISRAQEMLLATPTRPMGAVAVACGFASESGFHRAFRQVTGTTPGEFRRAAGR